MVLTCYNENESFQSRVQQESTDLQTRTHVKFVRTVQSVQRLELHPAQSVILEKKLTMIKHNVVSALL